MSVDEGHRWDPVEPLDPRLTFFVRNAKTIRQWSDLEREVSASADAFLSRILEDVATIGSIPGVDVAEVSIEARADREWPGIALRRPGWPASSALVCLEWWTKRIGLEGPAAPYVGVLLPDEILADTAHRNVFRALLAAHRVATRGRMTNRWATLRTVPLDPGLAPVEGADLTTYRSRLFEELAREWHVVAPLIDEAIAAIAQGA